MDRLRAAGVSAARSILGERLHRWIPRSTAQHAALRLGGGTAIAQALMVITAPIITRLYSPTEVGQYGLMLSFIGFASVGLNFRYDMAIVPAATDEEADRLLVVAAMIAVPTAVFASAFMLSLISRDMLSFGALPASAAGVVFAVLVVTGVFSAARYWAIRQQDFATVARASVAQGAGRAVLPVVAGFFGAGWLGLMLGELVGRGLGIGQLMRTVFTRVKATVRRSSLTSIRASASLNWRYPLIVTPSSLMDALGGALPLPMVAAAFGAPAAGQLLIVQRLAGVSASLVGASVADVFHATISSMFRQAPQNVRAAVWRTVIRLAGIATALYIPLGLFSYFGFSLIFGSAWTEAGFLVALFTPLSIVSLAVSPVTRLFLVVNRPELKLIFDVAFVAVPFFSFVVLHARGVGYWGCMIAYVASGTLAYLLYLALTLWAAGLTPRSRDSIQVA